MGREPRVPSEGRAGFRIRVIQGGLGGTKQRSAEGLWQAEGGLLKSTSECQNEYNKHFTRSMHCHAISTCSKVNKLSLFPLISGICSLTGFLFTAPLCVTVSGVVPSRASLGRQLILCSRPGTRPFSLQGRDVVGPGLSLSLLWAGRERVGPFSFTALGRGPGRSSHVYLFLYTGPGTWPIPSQPPSTQPGARPGRSLTFGEHSTGRQGTPLVPTFSSTLSRGPGRSLRNPP